MSLSGSRAVFPFTAIVDQERLKLALLLNAINPRIGGVLIRGTKGTGKSTTVRALVDLLPEVETVGDCPFRCNPSDPTNMCEVCRSRAKGSENFPVASMKMEVVELPIGATEDRVVGSLNIERAIREGVRALEPGILAEANQNVLYVDEINLLPDHITDVILDAAASGWNTVEREGISVQHPSRFILVGTMNPEEGELRPQLLDRMALHTEISTITDPGQRVAVMKFNLEFEDEPVAFREGFEEGQKELMEKIMRAKELLPKVTVPDHLYEVVARMCTSLNVDGHRPDIITVKSAKTLAAFNGSGEVEPKDILDCAFLALSHRTRNLGMDPPASEEQIGEAYEKAIGIVAMTRG
ncbi:MAG: ATP-binding protein [Candidatus Bathyarchaeota archaeon]|nr:MAG: ATP-binding protein [Candidatus Bathyarchaeota archaeon]